MVNTRSILIISALLGVMLASGLWLYRFYNVVPVGPGDAEARALGFTSSKRYSDISRLVRNAKPRQDFSNSQFALVEDVLSSPEDSVVAKGTAVLSFMTLRSTDQRVRAIELMTKYSGKDKNIDQCVRDTMKTYCLEGSRSAVEKAANGSSPISEIAKQALMAADQQQVRIDAAKKEGK